MNKIIDVIIYDDYNSRVPQDQKKHRNDYNTNWK